MQNFSGQSIDRYYILEPLGEGGMSIVYKAFDTRLECDVAVKFIRSERLNGDNSAKALKRFKDEAQKTAVLSHPNIVPVIDYGEFDGTPYLVMRYMPGGTLKQALQNRLQKGLGPYPYPEAAAILAPIARALEVAHQAGLVHRDVKPSNILMTQTGQPMLTDFGVAKILENDATLDNQTGVGIGIGTPEYMAPEQWEGKEIDGRADVYALGVVFYELVTGRTPYRAETIPAMLIKVFRDPLPRPREFVKDIPEAVEKVLFKALAKKTEDRYADMGAFAQILEKLANERTNFSYKKFNNSDHFKGSYKKKKFVPRISWILSALLCLAIVFISIRFFRPSLNNFSFEAQTSSAAETDLRTTTPQKILRTGSESTPAMPPTNPFISETKADVIQDSPAMEDRQVTTTLTAEPRKHSTPSATSTTANGLDNTPTVEIDLPVGMLTPMPVSTVIISPSNINRLQKFAVWENTNYYQDAFVRDRTLNWGTDPSINSYGEFDDTLTLPDGSLLIRNGWNWKQVQYKVEFRNPLDNSLIQTFEDLPTYKMLIAAPNSKQIALINKDNAIEVRDVDSFSVAYTLVSNQSGSVKAISFSPDSAYLAVLYSSGYIDLWKLGKESQLKSYSVKVNRGEFPELIFTPDSKRLIFLSRVGTIQIWNTGTGELEGDITSYWTSFAISPSSTILAIGLKNGTIQLWNLNTRSVLLTTEKHDVPFYVLAFSPDEKVLVSGNSNAGDVFYWNTEDGALITKKISVTNSLITSISVSPNGSLLMVGEHDYTTGTNTTHFYDTETTQEVFSLESPNGFVFSNDGTKLITFFQRQKVWGVYSLEIWGITP